MRQTSSRFFMCFFAIFALFAVFVVHRPAAQEVQEPTFPAPAVGASMESLRSTFITYWDWKLATEPELARRVGRTEFNDRWRDVSKSGRDRGRERGKESRQQLSYMSRGSL